MKSRHSAGTAFSPLIFGLGSLFLCLAAVNGLRAEPMGDAPKPAPDFDLMDLAGKEVKLADFKGKALLVFFWTTWSKPCQDQLKALTELQQQYGGKDFSVLGISLDDKGADAVKSFADTQKLNFPIIMGDYKVVQDFGGLQAIPTTFLIEKNHYIIQRHVGIVEKSTLENELKSIMPR
jgi:peroxiredoxin